MTVPVRALEVLAIGLAAGVLVERALALTGAGAVMRAVGDDARAAALLGVPTERVVLVGVRAGRRAGRAGRAADRAAGADRPRRTACCSA